MAAATAQAKISERLSCGGEAPLNFPPELIESMTTDQITGLLLLRMRALLARGFEPSEAVFGAARLAHVRI